MKRVFITTRGASLLTNAKRCNTGDDEAALPAFIASDPQRAGAKTRLVMPIDMDETETRASTRKLAEIVRRENVRLTIYGHDAGQWATLKHAPEFYD